MMMISTSAAHGNDRIASLAMTTTETFSPPTAIEPQHETQVLVRLNNEKTHVLKFPYRNTSKCCNESSEACCNPTIITSEEILQKLSVVTKIPLYMLRLHPSSSENLNVNVKFLSAFTFLPICGGKGGFGTLLKGQSKQAGARRTTDFGACRDLNGRRLRHVNDEIKLRVWRESMNRRMRESSKNGGLIDVDKEIQELRTASGIRNWHLMTPSWGAGEMSNKARRKEDMKLRREIERYAREQKIAMEKQMEKKRAWDQTVKNYAYTTQKYLEVEEEKISKSIMEGMKKRRKVQVGVTKAVKTEAEGDIETDGAHSENIDCISEETEYSKSASLLSSSILCTLSGDVVIEEEDTKIQQTMVQSKSEFATTAILINPSRFDRKHYSGIYYEITVESAGVAQLGWAKITVPTEEKNTPAPATVTTASDSSTTRDSFQPNSDTGDGVGDDSFSYGYDGRRRLRFHNGKETPYGSDINEWKRGDVIGCIYDVCEGSISFSVNGVDLGTAYEYHPPSTTGSKDDSDFLYPVFSLNENEVVSLNIGPSFRHCPKDKQGVFDLVNKDESTGKPQSDETHLQDKGAEHKTTSTSGNDTMANPEPINLDTYHSAEELESVGMSRLKEELYQRGLKCGGNLKERASRLFAIKGLSREEIPRKLRGRNFVP